MSRSAMPFAWLCAVLLGSAMTAGSARPSAALAADPHDEVIPLVRRIDAYFRSNKVDGVTLDSRFAINPSEAIRQGVVCQLLGYAELCRAHPSRRFRREIARHADYLTAHLLQVNSGTPFDGMLGYSLVIGFEFSGDSTHLAAARVIIDELKAIPTGECVLNGGLMVAMAMVEWYQVTGDTNALQKGRDIIASVPPYQNADGSFPHWCSGTTDIHYTGWMSQELILLDRTLHDPVIGQMLARTAAFAARRVDSTGLSHYEEPCLDVPGCWIYFDSYRSGCTIDYDTRGITVEPGYMALLFDHASEPRFAASMHYLLALENHGTFKDKWAYIEPPGDPQYPWSSADTSVANMSILFWSMASILSGHPQTAHEADLWWADEGSEDPIDATEPLVNGRHIPVPTIPISARLAPSERRWLEGVAWAVRRHEASALSPPGVGARDLALSASPLGSARLGWRIGHSDHVRLAVHDVTGRVVRVLEDGERSAGAHEAVWDFAGPDGRRVSAGLYFARLSCAGGSRTVRVLVLH